MIGWIGSVICWISAMIFPRIPSVIETFTPSNVIGSVKTPKSAGSPPSDESSKPMPKLSPVVIVGSSGTLLPKSRLSWMSTAASPLRLSVAPLSASRPTPR